MAWSHPPKTHKLDCLQGPHYSAGSFTFGILSIKVWFTPAEEQLVNAQRHPDQYNTKI